MSPTQQWFECTAAYSSQGTRKCGCSWFKNNVLSTKDPVYWKTFCSPGSLASVTLYVSNLLSRKTWVKYNMVSPGSGIDNRYLRDCGSKEEHWRSWCFHDSGCVPLEKKYVKEGDSPCRRAVSSAGWYLQVQGEQGPEPWLGCRSRDRTGKAHPDGKEDPWQILQSQVIISTHLTL